MLPLRFLFLFTFSSNLYNFIDSLNILGILPFTSNSHFNIGYAIIKTLYEAGHNVTVISAYPRKQKMENFTDIDGSSILEVFKKSSYVLNFQSVKLINLFVNFLLRKSA